MNYPVFWRIPVEVRAKLIKAQQDMYGEKLKIPPEPKEE